MTLVVTQYWVPGVEVAGIVMLQGSVLVASGRSPIVLEALQVDPLNVVSLALGGTIEGLGQIVLFSL